jgi:dihydrofolate synthase/folylpolyglutamate synthase
VYGPISYREIEERLTRAASPGIRPGLARVARLAAGMGHPERRFPSVQIVGTNGKGSTAATLDAILRAEGLRVGRYTSPHLVSPSERLSLDGAPLSVGSWSEGLERVLSAVEADPILRTDPPTFFELFTMLALDRFASERCDLAVVEAGMGGRYDATTILGDVAAVGITPIGLDHMEYLGKTVEAVGEEKFAVIRPGRPAVFAGSPRPLVHRFLERCALLGAIPEVRPDHWRIEDVRVSLEGTDFTLAGPGFGPRRLHTPLIGPHQAENAALAAALAAALTPRFGPVSEEAVEAGIRGTLWPGRLQILRRDPLILLDGAHNAHGIAALAAALRSLGRAAERPALVFAAMRDKDIEGALSLLRPLGGTLFPSEVPGNPRSTSAEELRRIAFRAGWDVPRAYPDPIDAVRAAQGTGRPLVACGSLYFVGAILAREKEILNR